MKIKESIFKLLSLLFILTFTSQQSYSQRIDTDIGVDGLFNVAKSNYESVLSSGSTFLCLSGFELQLYDEPGSPNSDFGTNGKLTTIYRNDNGGLINAVSAIDQKANYYGCYGNSETDLLEIAIASFDLEEKNYNISYAQAGVFVEMDTVIQEIIGITELVESTLIFGYRNDGKAMFKEIDHQGVILQESEIESDNNMGLVSVTEDESNRYFVFGEGTEPLYSLLTLNKFEMLTQEKFDNQKQSIFGTYHRVFNVLGAQAIVINGKIINTFYKNSVHVGAVDLATNQATVIDVEAKMPLDCTFKGVHIKEDGTILVTGIVNNESSYRLFVMALDSEGELVSNFGINGIYFLEIDDFSDALVLNNTYYNNGRLVFSVSDLFVGNFFIPVVFDNFVETKQVEFTEFSLYPNPSISFIGIDSERLQKVDEITIYDTNGRQILSQKHNGENSLSINIAELETATYIISFSKNDELVGSQSFMKQ